MSDELNRRGAEGAEIHVYLISYDGFYPVGAHALVTGINERDAKHSLLAYLESYSDELFKKNDIYSLNATPLSNYCSSIAGDVVIISTGDY